MDRVKRKIAKSGGRFGLSNDFARYGYDITAPYGFWTDKKGHAEAKRRIDMFTKRNGSLPTPTEIKILGLTGFIPISISYEKYKVTMVELGYEESLINTALQKTRAERRVFKQNLRSDPETELKPWKIASLEEIKRYGIDISTPKGFWKSQEGVEEAKRRIDGFYEINKRLPNDSETERLGLSGFKSDYFRNERFLGTLGYDETEIEAIKRPWILAKPEEIAKYGIGVKAPKGFWYSGEGRAEARRRVNAFIDERKELPSPKQFRELGLPTFYYDRSVFTLQSERRLGLIKRN